MALPSKLVRPAAAGLIERRALFGALDAALASPFTWIAAPAGAGKTSLVSSWIESRRLPTLWYQLDAGDADPATFFHYLGRGAPALCARGRRPSSLPPLTPEYLPGLDVFTRRFVETLTGSAPTPSLLVFDNYQEVPPTEVLQRITRTLVAALAPGTTAVFISRDPPPPVLARHLADASVTLLDGNDLRLADDEALAIVTAQGIRDAAVAGRLTRLARGWAAGLTLLARGSAGGHLPDDAAVVTEGSLAHYFGTEVFGVLDEPARQTLMRLSLLPRVSDRVARGLCGESSPTLLDSLHARQVFVSRRTEASERTYEFHPLFREFLHDQALRNLSAQMIGKTRTEAARLLEAEESIDEAIGLYIDARSWAQAARLIGGHAASMLDQGRGTTLLQWLGALPDHLVRADGWLLHWRGLSSLASGAPGAREDLQTACDVFHADGDPIAELIGCGGVMNAFFFEQVDFTGAFPWADRLEALYAAHENALAPDQEATLISHLGSVQYMGLTHPLFDRVERRAHLLATTHADPAIALRVMPLAMAIAVFRGDLALARHWSRLLDELVGRQPFLAPVRIVSEMYAAVVSWQEARHEDAYRNAMRGIDIGREAGIRVFEGVCQYHIAYTALSAGDLDRAESALGEAVALVPPGRVADLMHLRSMQAMVLTLRGDLTGAIETLKSAVQTFRRSSVFFGEATATVQLGQALMLAGCHPEARACLARGLELARRMRSDILTFQASMALAWSLLAGGDEPSGRTVLRDALAVGARRDYMNCHPLWLPAVMSRLFAVALEDGIEVPYVQRFIATRRLASPDPDLAQWPWPVRVHVLGHFEILVDGRPLEARRKEQRRLTGLLRTIIAAGGRVVSRQVLTDAIWPDSDGDAAIHAYEVTLHRLRKALGRDDAILQAHGQVSLNNEVVWVDALAFDRLVDRIDRDGETNDVLAARLAEKAIRLYRGHFPDMGDESPIEVACRERLRQRYRRLLRLAVAMPALAARAGAWRRRAVELEPTLAAQWSDAAESTSPGELR